MDNSFVSLDNNFLRNLGLWDSCDSLDVSNSQAEQKQQPTAGPNQLTCYTSEFSIHPIQDSLSNESSASLLGKRNELQNREQTSAKKPRIQEQAVVKELSSHEQHRLNRKKIACLRQEKIDCLLNGLNSLRRLCEAKYGKHTIEYLSSKQRSDLRLKSLCLTIEYINNKIIDLAKQTFGETFVDENKLELVEFSYLDSKDFNKEEIDLNQTDKRNLYKQINRMSAAKSYATNKLIISNALNGYNHLLNQVNSLLDNKKELKIKKLFDLPDMIDSENVIGYIHHIVKKFITKDHEYMPSSLSKSQSRQEPISLSTNKTGSHIPLQLIDRQMDNHFPLKPIRHLALKYVYDGFTRDLEILIHEFNSLNALCQTIVTKNRVEKLCKEQTSETKSRLIFESIHYINNTIIDLSKKLMGEEFVHSNKLEPFTFQFIDESHFKSEQVKNYSGLNEVERKKIDNKLQRAKKQEFNRLNCLNLLNSLNYLTLQAHILLLNQHNLSNELLTNTSSQEDIVNISTMLQNILDSSRLNLMIQSILDD